MSETAPNIAGSYKQAYDFLFGQLTSDTQAKVRAAVNSDREPGPEVRQFCKNVIALAEQGS
jgi:hypothetical protein